MHPIIYPHYIIISIIIMEAKLIKVQNYSVIVKEEYESIHLITETKQCTYFRSEHHTTHNHLLLSISKYANNDTYSSHYLLIENQLLSTLRSKNIIHQLATIDLVNLNNHTTISLYEPLYRKQTYQSLYTAYASHISNKKSISRSMRL